MLSKAESVSLSLNALATIFVLLRLVSRFGILKKSFVDDYLIILGVVLSWCLTNLILAQGRFGLGRHQNEVSSQNFEIMLLLFYISIPVYNLSLTITKLSALFQFLRFFVTRGPRLAAWALISIVSVYGMTTTIVSICSCRPIRAFWDQSTENQSCINLLVFWYTNASFNIITDIAVVILPLYVLKDLRLSRQQRWAVTAIFVVGGITCITSIMRVHTIHTLLRAVDVTYDNADVVMWSSIEVNTAVACACMQSLKPLIQRIGPKRFLRSESSTHVTEGSGTTLNLSYVKPRDSTRIDVIDRFEFSSTEPILDDRP